MTCLMQSLQRKAFMDLMLYFGRRGRENLIELKIIDFALTTDENGLRYIYLKKDELTTNHQEEGNTADGHMYEIRGTYTVDSIMFILLKNVNEHNYGNFTKCRVFIVVFNDGQQ